ncbi:hypothetical protein CW304_08035 [Bacillus sp. UFRGS-B20]|nr:hypothetical protein CW304_08035 [Bacillus sp. UFRGS-B20]
MGVYFTVVIFNGNGGNKQWDKANEIILKLISCLSEEKKCGGKWKGIKLLRFAFNDFFNI